MKASCIFLLLVCFLILPCNKVAAQLKVDGTKTVDYLVKKVLSGDGITILNITNSNKSGTIGFFDGRQSNIGIDSGIILSTGTIYDAVGPNNIGNKSTSNNLPGDPELQLLSPNYNTYDASYINFEFIPQSNTVKFRFVFGSEEYPEFDNQDYNDVFGIFISGPGFLGNENIALIPGSNEPISIQTINAAKNSAFYVDNSNGLSIQYDAFSKVFEIVAPVVPCELYSLKFAIADVKDFIFDSGIFIEAKSLNSANNIAVMVEEQRQLITECDSAGFVISRANSNTSQALTVDYIFKGSAILGFDYIATPASSIVIPAGALNAFVKIKPITDIVVEVPESIILQVSNPVVCDSVSAFFTLLDYKPLAKIDFVLLCGDSITTIIIAQSDLLDSIKWYDQNQQFKQIGNSISIAITDTNQYVFTSIERCTGLAISDSIKLEYYPISTNQDTTVCEGDTLSLFALSGLLNAKYKWLSSTEPGLNAGQFIPSVNVSNPKFVVADSCIITVRIDNDLLCSQKAFRIKVAKLQVADTIYSICQSGSVQLQASGGTSYLWNPSIGLTNDSIGNPIASPLVNTNYTVQIKNGSCEETFLIKIIVDTIPIAKAGSDQLICSRQTVQLLGSGSDYGTYEWFPANSVDDPFLANPKASPTVTTQYFLKAFNGSCFSIDSLTIFVVDSVSSKFNYSYDSCAKTIALYPVANIENSNFLWDFGDGNFSTANNPVHQYNQDGNYRIQLVTNPLAPCRSEHTLDLVFPLVDKSLRKYPSVFSPNNDGINDRFIIYGENSPCAISRMRIYNRWGEVVFESTKNFEWDGTYKGQLLPSGTYIYFIDGDGFTDKGVIALIN